MIYKHNQEFVKWREGMRDSVNGYTERDAFEAGQQSQQAKIDELQDEIQGYKRIYGELELKRDELQVRVDEALKQLDLAYPESWGCCVEQAIDILKGNKDD